MKKTSTDEGLRVAYQPWVPKLGEAADRLFPYEVTYCPACGEECPADATWCRNYFAKGKRTSVVPVRVRWAPQVLSD